MVTSKMFTNLGQMVTLVLVSETLAVCGTEGIGAMLGKLLDGSMVEMVRPGA